MKKSYKRIILFIVIGIGVLLAGVAVYLKFVLPHEEEPPYLEIAVVPERIQRGQYLAHNVAVCMDCHSERNWKLFSGPLVEGSLGKGGEYFGPEFGFPGEFYARNLTPANLGKWTDGEIFRAITTGINREGKALFPLMPYLKYQKMDKEDIYDIIAYLRTLEPIEDNVPPSKAHFPMNFIINTIPKKGESGKKPDRSDKIAYGSYLVNAASCMECHSQEKQGQLISGLEYSGGREFLMPFGIIRSANITPDKETGIGAWDEDSFVARFKTYSKPESAYPVGENDFNTIMPWTMYAQMEEEDLRAIYAYLSTLPPKKNQVVRLAAR